MVWTRFRVVSPLKQIKTKNPNPSPIGKRFGFCVCGAPPGTRTLGPLIKRHFKIFCVSDMYCKNVIYSVGALTYRSPVDYKK